MSSKSLKVANALVAMVMVLGLLVASCGPTPAPTPVPPEEPTAMKEPAPTEEPTEGAWLVAPEASEEEEMGEPVSGGHLRVALFGTIMDTGDSHLTTSGWSLFMVGHVLDTYLRWDPATWTYNPGLAESWEISDDGRSLILHLRKDVKFHDGTPFDAQVAEYNLNRIATLPEAKGKGAYNMLNVDNLEKIEVIDDYTIRITYKEVYGQMLWAFSFSYLAPHSPTAIEKYGKDYGTEMVVGTGPFKWVEWTGPSGEFTCVRNEDYAWPSPIYDNQGPAYIDGFTIKGMGEAATRVAALESGDVDIAMVPNQEVARFNELPDFKTLLIPPGDVGDVQGLAFNLNSSILKDIRVRQAIAHAIDREGILQSPIYSGIGRVQLSILSPWVGSEEEFREYNYLYDPDKAKALLEEVGWKDEDGDGIREAHGVEGIEDGTTLTLLHQTDPDTLPQSELLEGLLTQVGIETEMRSLDFTSSQAKLEEGDYHITFRYPGTLHEHFNTDGRFNIYGYSNPKVDELTEGIVSTWDTEEKLEYQREAVQIVLQDVPMTPVVLPMMPLGMSKKVAGSLLVGHGHAPAYFYGPWINPEP
jgi:peptide/nickel transport system substrate-binding protein